MSVIVNSRDGKIKVIGRASMTIEEAQEFALALLQHINKQKKALNGNG
jgi:cyanophycinase-like exopeptidase